MSLTVDLRGASAQAWGMRKDEPTLSESEQRAASALETAGLPLWEYKARAAIYAQGHRGILDLDLDFPKAYLKGPAPECYVWKTEVEDGTRVHAYADVDGNCFHLEWDEGHANGQEKRTQNQPEHQSGPCNLAACRACLAAKLTAGVFVRV